MNHDRPTDIQLDEYNASYITLHLQLRKTCTISIYSSTSQFKEKYSRSATNLAEICAFIFVRQYILSKQLKLWVL